MPWVSATSSIGGVDEIETGLLITRDRVAGEGEAVPVQNPFTEATLREDAAEPPHDGAGA